MACSPLNKLQLKAIRSLPGNDRCCDCDKASPQWASLTFGILVCLECSGVHRGLGVHISFIRSLTLDGWSGEQVKRMLLAGGNDVFKHHFEYATKISPVEKGVSKYASTFAYHYRISLNYKLEGRLPPDVLSEQDHRRAREIMKDHARQMSNNNNNKELWQEKQPQWFPDDGSSTCTICSRPFTLLFRRHHCRHCGALACKLCAPANNSKPILRLGIKEPVRHCKICYKSPLLRWPD